MDKLQSKYKEIEKRIKFNENAMKDNELKEQVETLTETLNNHSSTLSSHSSLIGEHSISISNLTQDLMSLKISDYGSSIDELQYRTGLRAFAFEPLYYIGGSVKVCIGSKANNGPFGTLFTRVSPATQLTGFIRLYISGIPSFLTSTSLDFYINGEQTQLNLSFITDKDYNLEISFDFFAKQVSNVFKVQFTNNILWDCVLDYMEIITENGQNFLCLNRDIYYAVNTFFGGNKTHCLYTGQISNTGRFVQYEDQFGANVEYGEKIITVPGTEPYLNINIMRSFLARKVRLGYYSTTIEQLSIGGDNNALYKTQKNSGQYTLLFDNVYDASSGYHWRDATYCICGTTLNQQLFIGSEQLTVNDIPTLKAMPFPNEFITCTPVKDLRIGYRPDHKEIGYLLLHNSGKIFYIEQDDGDYFIEIGFGSQPNAYMQEDYQTIYIYYHFNNMTYRKVLIFNTETNRWKLSKEFIAYSGVREIVEFNDYGYQLRYLVDGTRQVHIV